VKLAGGGDVFDSNTLHSHTDKDRQTDRQTDEEQSVTQPARRRGA